jgi:hypothetical protein
MKFTLRDLKNMFNQIPEWALDKDVVIHIGKYETIIKEHAGTRFTIDYGGEEGIIQINYYSLVET